MKRIVNSILVLSVAALLGACGKKDEAKAQFQAAAEKQLLKIAGKISVGKGVRRGSRGLYQTNDNGWIPYNNVFQRNSATDELAECQNFLAEVTPTRANFKARLGLVYQCATQVLQYRNGFQTALYRNLGDEFPMGQQMGQQISDPQQAAQYGWSWRYPYQYPNYTQSFGQNQQTYQYQNTYGQSGYIPTTVQYSGNQYVY
jgi:hypothetical protein